MNENEYDEDRMYYEGLGEEMPLTQPKAIGLPKVVEQYVKSAADVSKYNEIPAAIGFFVILGQLCKDMVAIPSGRRVDDTRIQFIWMQTSGRGLVAYDEFEYSGVFKQTQHKENVIMYLNKFMNTLHGENWIIRKKLRDGDIIECRCQRSIYATTYIPKTLTNVIAEKGVIQRTLIYIKEVPQEVQDELREKVLDEVGTIKPKDAPIKKFAQNFVIIYESLRKRFDESGRDPLQTITFGKGYNDALKNESIKMRNYVANSRPEVFEIAGNFITRLNQTMTRLSVLCCIAEAPNIKDPSKRYIVTERHARQASSLIRQCYKSLVSWLDVALKVKTHALHERVGINAFREAYEGLRKKGDEGWVNKTLLLSRVREETKKGQTTVYNNFKKISSMFDTKKIGVRTYLKIKEEKKNE